MALGRTTERIDVLRHWPTSGGLLLERAGGEPNFGFHAVGLLALRALQIDHDAGIARLISAIEQARGVATAPSPHQQQDNGLQAWSWIPNTFSWVEPTAWCLLALKKWSGVQGTVVDASRRQIAERMLVDRACADGGWNYGNSNILGQQLKAFVPTTALALLAMQDLQTEPVVRRSRDYLERQGTSERSGVALSLTHMCLTAYGRPAEPVRAALEQQIPTTLALQHQLSAAMTLCALQPGAGDAAVTL
jgi:hypothetical protein